MNLNGGVTPGGQKAGAGRSAGSPHSPDDLREASKDGACAVEPPPQRECDIPLHMRSVGKYLARWGFTPCKSLSVVPTNNRRRRSRSGLTPSIRDCQADQNRGRRDHWEGVRWHGSIPTCAFAATPRGDKRRSHTWWKVHSTSCR